MSNAELVMLTCVAFGLHLLTLGVAIVRRRPQVIARIGLIFSATILFLMALSLHWPIETINVPLVGLAVLELAIAAAALNAMRSGSRRALAGAWIGFSLHMIMSGLAVLFALTFRINRLM